MPSVKTPSEVAFDTADSEGLFELDGMDENPPTTFHSEDETDTEGMSRFWSFGFCSFFVSGFSLFMFDVFLADSETHEGGMNISRTQPSASILAKSLPVSVPVFPGAHNHGNDFEDEDDVS